MAIISDHRFPDSMDAVVCHGIKDYRLQEMPVPEPGPGDIVVKVSACGICASDIKCYLGAPLFWGDDKRPQFVETPVIPGHEFIGEVVALGEGAEEKHGVSLGDIAIAEQILPCWNCMYCKRGMYWLCKVSNVFGFQQVCQGGMATYMKYPARAIVHKVPADMPVSNAALIEPLACAIHAVERGEIKLGDIVVIAGAGPLGLLMVGAAHLKTPGKLIVLDMRDDRLDLAHKMGADITINPSREDPIEQIRSLSDGYGCDVFIEATGHPEAVVTGLHAIRKAGTFVEFSVMKEPVTVDWTIIGDVKELNIHGAHLGPYCYPTAIDYIHRNLIDVAPLVTHELSLSEYQKGLDAAANPVDSIKILLRP